MVATEARLRIGEVARRVGTTPRTIRQRMSTVPSWAKPAPSEASEKTTKPPT